MSYDYEQIKDGDWIRPTLKGHRDQCCGCGLVHVLDFFVADRVTGKKIPNSVVHVRVRTDWAETKAARRKLKREKKA